MNTFTLIHTYYIRPSKTIETILVTNSIYTKVFYIYNYDGLSFRVFENIFSIIIFFNGESESEYHFESDEE